MVGEALLSVFTREPRDGLDYVRTEEFICTGTWKTKRVGATSLSLLKMVTDFHQTRTHRHSRSRTHADRPVFNKHLS